MCPLANLLNLYGVAHSTSGRLHGPTSIVLLPQKWLITAGPANKFKHPMLKIRTLRHVFTSCVQGEGI